MGRIACEAVEKGESSCLTGRIQPIDLVDGWDINIKGHQSALELILRARRPRILYGAPDCGIWSNSNTSTPENVKREVRELQMSGLRFWRDKCFEQLAIGRSYLFENPKASELLKVPVTTDLLQDGRCKDYFTDMCCHKLRDPYTQMPHKKPTALRSTIALTKTSKLCDGTHSHQMLQGRLPDGRSRTSVAAAYTRPFCRCVIKDCIAHLADKDPKRAFPTTVTSEGVEEDGYEDLLRDLEAMEQAEQQTAAPSTPGRVRGEFLEPKTKKLAKPPAPSVRRVPFQAGGSSSSSAAPIAPPPGLEAVVPQPPDQEVVPAGQDAVVALPKPLEPVSAKELTKEDKIILNNLLKQAAPRTGEGGIVAISTGPRLRLLQDMFGTPHGKIIKLGIIGRRPAAVPHPEPMLSRAEAVVMKLIVCLKEEEDIDKSLWHETRWIPFELRQFKGAKAKPPWVIVMYGRDRTDSIEDVVAISPVDTLAEQPEEAHKLEGVLQCLAEGSTEDKLKLLLSLHKRFYHKPPAALRTLLHRSGVPLRTLSLVDTACEMCHICKRWTATGTRPAAKSSLAYSFNESIYIDVVFFDDGQMFLFCIDEAIRYLVIAHIEAKSFEHLETVFRRAWIAHYGPPRQIISDKEGSLAGEMFGVYSRRRLAHSFRSVGPSRETVPPDGSEVGRFPC